MTTFKEEWTVESAMAILSHPTVDSEIWAEAVEWLRTRPAPDLIVSDIRLSDGDSFDVFEQVPVTAPVIFTTAHDEHLIEAFAVHAVDYLLKPVQRDKFHRALAKYAAAG